MRVRKAEPGDAGQVADMVRALASDIGAQIVPKVTGEQILQLAFGANPLLSVLVAESAGGLAGAILLEPLFSTWRGQRGFYIVDLYVAAARRGEGIGEALMRAAAREAHASGGGFLTLDVEPGNAAAKRLYARLGFAKSPDEIMTLDRDALERLLHAPPIL